MKEIKRIKFTSIMGGKFVSIPLDILNKSVIQDQGNYFSISYYGLHPIEHSWWGVKENPLKFLTKGAPDAK